MKAHRLVLVTEAHTSTPNEQTVPSLLWKTEQIWFPSLLAHRYLRLPKSTALPHSLVSWLVTLEAHWVRLSTAKNMSHSTPPIPPHSSSRGCRCCHNPCACVSRRGHRECPAPLLSPRFLVRVQRESLLSVPASK